MQAGARRSASPDFGDFLRGRSRSPARREDGDAAMARLLQPVPVPRTGGAPAEQESAAGEGCVQWQLRRMPQGGIALAMPWPAVALRLGSARCQLSLTVPP